MFQNIELWVLLVAVLLVSSCKETDQFIAKKTFNTSELNIFQIYSGKFCEIESPSGFTTVNCENLVNFVDPTSKSCSKLGLNSRAFFPGQARPMQLCRTDSLLQLRGQTNTVRFTMYGDVGVGEDLSKDHFQMSVAKAMHNACPPTQLFNSQSDKTCDFALVAGDLVYPNGVRDVWDQQFETKFERIYEQLGRYDIYAVPGNHDYHGNVQAMVDYTHFSDRWRMPARSFAIPGLPEWLRVYGLNTTPLIDGGEDMPSETWGELVREFCSNNNGVNILFGHHPQFSHGKHGSEPDIAPIIDRIKATCPLHFYMAGHDHHQEHVHSNGVDFIVQGAGGAKTHGVDSHAGQTREAPFYDGLRSYQQRYALDANGFAIVEATRTADNTVVQLYFYAVDPRKAEDLQFEDFVYSCIWSHSNMAEGCRPVYADSEDWIAHN